MAKASTNFDIWYFSRKEIELNSPSRKDGIDAKTETEMRNSYCTYLQELGMTLGVTQITIATSIVFCHRFYLRNSLANHNPTLIATSCMRLAYQGHETPADFHDLITTSYRISHKTDPSAKEKIRQSDVYSRQKQLVMKGENLLFGSLGFDYDIDHPYIHLIDVIKKVKLHKNHALAQVAWNFVNDSLRTCLCLQYKPHKIAAAATFIAARFLKDVVLPSLWWKEVDVSPRDLEDICTQMLELYGEKAEKLCVEEVGSTNTQESSNANDPGRGCSDSTEGGSHNP